MKPEEIKWNDWYRILIGEAPPEYFWELVIRALVIFFILVVSLRLLGRRMAAQLSRTEMVAMFSLAAAIGVPMLSPDRGILPAVVIAMVVVGVGRLIAARAYRHSRFEVMVDGKLHILIESGVMNLKNMKKTQVTRERLFAELRSNSIRHLGEVRRLYFEANGAFSLIQEPQPRPGLNILPDDDVEYRNAQKESNTLVCHNCGKEKEQSAHASCPNCNHQDWLPAIE